MWSRVELITHIHISNNLKLYAFRDGLLIAHVERIIMKQIN